MIQFDNIRQTRFSRGLPPVQDIIIERRLRQRRDILFERRHHAMQRNSHIAI